MILETENLRLRPFHECDELALFDYLHEPQVHCFYDMKIDTLEQAQEELKKRMNDDTYFAIEVCGSHRVIGEIFAHAEATDPMGKMKDTYSPCWMLHKDYQGKGYGYEAAHAFIDYLFNVKNARRVYMYTEDYNIPCQKLCEKLGARKEGYYKEFVSFINDENGNPIYENTYEYAILKKEWKG